MAQIITIINFKGGVGKTTCSVEVSAALAKHYGRRTLLVDLDPQAALTAGAGISVPHLTVSVYQALLDERIDPLSIIQSTSSCEPSTVALTPRRRNHLYRSRRSEICVLDCFKSSLVNAIRSSPPFPLCHCLADTGDAVAIFRGREGRIGPDFHPRIDEM